MTGLWCFLFDELVEELEPQYVKAKQARLERVDRQRALGGGQVPALGMQDQILLTVIWLRCYPKQNVLGYLFGVSQATVSRVISFVLPLLEQVGRDTMRLPDPDRKARRDLPALLAATPGLAIVIDTFEQRVQRPQEERKAADAYYSGKKKQHTLKSQVAVDAVSGLVVDVADSVVGPQSDLKTLADLAYLGIDKLHPNGRCPIRKPKGKPRTPEQIAFNTAFSRQRIIVEHTICRLRHFDHLPNLTANIAVTIPLASSRWQVLSIGTCGCASLMLPNWGKKGAHSLLSYSEYYLVY